ncbi:unnamed protein product [Prorocentrum cordatum]|uniref:Selenoprotein O n=1 Tax=Prorocentrum cordatum TaxID=2364126 RepID=A0ABN9TZ25_9DINO|nr:unnamed protein product [Polarella glacialis]
MPDLTEGRRILLFLPMSLPWRRCDGAAAERWYAAMLADIGLPDTVAHNAVLAACARAADAARVELWLGRTMPVGRLRPDEVTYTGNTVLDAYARGGSGEEVEARFLQLTAGAEPWVSARTFAIRMRPWAYAGDSARVEQQWREMEALGVRPEACNMWALLTALARARPPRAEAAARRYQERSRLAGGETDHHVLRALRRALGDAAPAPRRAVARRGEG